MGEVQFKKVSDYLWEMPPAGCMTVPGRIYASDKLMEAVRSEKSPDQVANVACLPGIIKYSLAMPDIHWGYGFPIGGVAAFDVQTGIVSPGGVGYDINCGVRLMRTNLFLKDIQGKIEDIVRHLYSVIPTGVGSSGAIEKISRAEERELVVKGARWAVERGYGKSADLKHIEDGGCISLADPSFISDQALQRGLAQVGTLGSGNHFLEIGKVTEIYRPEIADVFDLQVDQIIMMIHTGSRGFGYQICDDYVKKLLKAAGRYGINLPDRQLACAPVNSPEGQEYLATMACAANYAWVNRQVIMALAEKAFARAMNLSEPQLGLDLIYDVCHNIAKIEEHEVDGQMIKVCVHRKGATRAFPPHHPLVPADYQETGQPVLVPGDMGRSSFLCVGTDEAMKQTFGSSCHGAGRVASRTQMLKKLKGHNLIQELAERGVFVMTKTHDSLAEEMPEAYKDVAEVVDVMEKAGISKKVAKFKPLGVSKG